MRKLTVILTLFTLILTMTLTAKERNADRSKIASILKSNVLVLGKFDGNRISCDVENTGQYVSYHRTGDAGLEWPKGSRKTADFAAGIWVAGKVRGTGELRTAAAEYQVEFEPGKILPNGQPDNADDPRYKIWKINKTDLYNPSDDYLNWPVEDGAPWEDVDGDGVFTRGVDRPLLMGDQTLWMVFNDANPAAHNIFKTAPMGLEVQMTIWGYNRVDAFGDMMFVKCVIINKSNNTYDSTFVALWDDPDLGYAGDDFVGCDTTLSLGYCYNASNTDNVYGSAPPAIGRDFFQGVKVYTGDPNDSAKAFGKWWKGYKNLPMYAFTFYWNGAPFPYRDPEFANEAYNFMRGYLADGTPYVDPNTNQATRFVFPFDLSLKSLDFGQIPLTTVDAPDGTGETFSPNYLTAALSYSRKMTDRIYVGANFKLISERILRESAVGFAVDIGLQYRLESGLRFGAVMKNVGGNMKFDGPDLEWGVVIPGSEPGAPVRSLRVPLQEFELPAAFELGFAYNLKFGESHSFTLAGSFQNNNFTLDEYKGGLEYSFNNMLFLRLGYSYVNETDYIFNSPSFGLGLNIPLGGTLEASVEYTYRKVKFFNNNQFITVRVAM